MDDEQLLRRLKFLKVSVEDAESKTTNLRVGMALSAARCQLATAITILDNELESNLLSTYEQAAIEQPIVRH